jgi:hypothetical protein
MLGDIHVVEKPHAAAVPFHRTAKRVLAGAAAGVESAIVPPSAALYTAPYTTSARLMASGSPAPTIVCVGHAALDRVFMVDHWPADSAKIVAHRYFESGGGMAANAAVAIARLGGQALFWGPVGADSAADIIEEQLGGSAEIPRVHLFDVRGADRRPR